MPWTTEFASKVWTVLTEECGARVDGRDRESFILAATMPASQHSEGGITEYRFGGSLGFGGKIYRGPPPYVTCYIEHSTPERHASILRANRRLEQLWLEATAT